MRKCIVAILAILYLSTTTGATVHVHYCMGKLAGWDLGHAKSKTCGSCGMENDEGSQNGCCKDETKFVKQVNDQKISDVFLINLVNPVVYLPVEFFLLQDFPLVLLAEQYPVSHAPPRSLDVAIYLRNSIFLI